MAAIRVAPDEPHPSHHLALTGPDGKRVGLILTDAAGNPDPTGMASEPYPRTAIKTYSGTSDLDSEEPPFNPITQRDFSGGLGKLVHDEDARRYREAHGLNTSYANKVFLQGRKEHMRGDYREMTNKDPKSVTFTYDSAYPYMAEQFTPLVSFSAKYIQVYVKKTNLPTTGFFQISLHSDSGGNPSTSLGATGSINVSSLNTLSAQHDDLMIVCAGSFATPVALTAGTPYWIRVLLPAAEAAGNYALATDADNQTGGKKSTNGSTWVTGPAFYYNIREDLAQFDAIFLNYNRANYMITQPVDKSTASRLYISGDRGMADDNSGDKTKLNDATKTWPVNAFAGAYVWLIHGPGSADERPYRKIVSNTATALTVDKAWTTTHTTKTSYVIIGSDYWTYVGAFGQYVHAAVVGYDRIYTAGESNQSYQWEINDGTYLPDEKFRTELDFVTKRTEWITAIPRGGVSSHYSSGVYIYAGPKGNHPAQTYDAGWTTRAYVLGGYPSSLDDAVAKPSLIHLIARIPLTSTAEELGNWSYVNPAGVTHSLTHGLVSIAIGAPFTTGVVGARDFPVTDFTAGDALVFFLFSNINANAGDFQIGWSDTTAMGGSPQWVDIPALTANTWHVVVISPIIMAGANKTQIISMGIKQVVAGACALYLTSEIYLTRSTPLYIAQNPMLIPNNVVTYSGSQDGTTTVNPWYFMQNGEIHELQTQNGDKMVQLRLPDSITQAGPLFGNAATQHGLYLYFNVGKKLQRYYNNQVDDVGPDRDDGLPSNQQSAYPWSLLSYAGRLYASYYGGNSAYAPSPSLSAIYAFQNDGWCEVVDQLYDESAPIRSIGAQITPEGPRYLMWVEGGVVMRTPISFDPLREPDYIFRNDGVMITGRYYAGRRDVEKFYKSLKITADNLEGLYKTNNVKITVWVRTDIDQTWKKLPDVFDVSPFEQIDLATTMDITGRWAQFKIMFDTNKWNITPVMYGLVIETMMRVTSKDAYNATFRLGNYETDLLGNPETMNAKQKYDVLREWLAGAKPITMATLDDLTHGLTVYPQPIPIRRTYRVIDEGGQKKGVWVCTMSFLEI